MLTNTYEQIGGQIKEMEEAMEQILQNFEQSLTEQGKAISTVKHALIYPRGFIGSNKITDLSQVKTQTILDYLAQLERDGCSDAKMNQAIWALRTFFKWANVPGLGFPRQKRPLSKVARRPLTEAQMKTIYDYCYYHTLDPLYFRSYVLTTMYYTGLRLKEIMTLSRKDFKFFDLSGESHSKLEITKQGLNRTVLIPRDFSERLQQYFRWEWEGANAFNATVGNINYMCLYLNNYQFAFWRDEIKIYPELFRISWACRCLERGMSLEELQKLMGHKSKRSTRRYLKLIDKSEVKEIAADTTIEKQVVTDQEGGQPKNENHL